MLSLHQSPSRNGSKARPLRVRAQGSAARSIGRGAILERVRPLPRCDPGALGAEGALVLGERIDGLSGPCHGSASYVERCAACWSDCGRAFYKESNGSEHGRTLCAWCAIGWSERAALTRAGWRPWHPCTGSAPLYSAPLDPAQRWKLTLAQALREHAESERTGARSYTFEREEA